MADPEEEAKALAETDTNVSVSADVSVGENQGIEDTSVTKENTEKQVDAAQSDESALPKDLEQDPEKQMDAAQSDESELPKGPEQQSDAAQSDESALPKELEKQSDAAQSDESALPKGPEKQSGAAQSDESALPEELEQDPEKQTDTAQSDESALLKELEQDPELRTLEAVEEPALGVAATEEPMQEVAVTEELPRGLDTVVKQEESHTESRDEDLKSQKDIPDVQPLAAEIEPSILGTSSPGTDMSIEPATDTSENLADVAAETQDVSGVFMNALPSRSKQLPEDTRNATATVKVMLHPDIQIFTMAFNMNHTMEQLKQYFATRLKIPPNILQLMLLGKIIENSETLWNLGVKPHGTIQIDMFSLDEEQFPIKSSKLLKEFYMPDVITVRVQTDPETFQDLVVEIKRPTFKKPFLGGFRHKETGVEYHHAGSQTIPKKRPEKGYEEFCRSTQTAFERKKLLQTRSATSTQMTKIGVYVSNITDKLIEPKKYVTAEEYHARRLQAVIVIQTYFRRWLAINLVKQLKEQLRLRLEWEKEEERRKQREKAERLMKEYNRRLVPRTKDDFELLYHALELWREEELERINSTFSGAERKAALCALLEKEAQLIASIGRHKLNADEVNQQKAIMSFLEKCAEPKKWKAFDGRTTEMDTQFTLRARELLEIYRSISMKDLPPDERLDVLLTLKHTVKEHECKLTHELMELIDREADLMMRGVKECNLEGLRKRICTLFLQYIKTPFFNPEVARLLKVPPDPIKLYHNIYFCLGCKRYLPSTAFAISSTSHTVGRCRLCCKLDNEACKREAFLKYKRMLRNLRDTEVNYMDGAKIAFIIQLQDLQYMVENFWGSQSALSAWDDLYDLAMVRWDKHQEWSPWNTILLTYSEADSHLKLNNLEKAYEMVFIHRIKHKHILARNYFSQFPELADTLHKDEKLACSNDLLVTKSLTPGPSKSHQEG